MHDRLCKLLSRRPKPKGKDKGGAVSQKSPAFQHTEGISPPFFVDLDERSVPKLSVRALAFFLDGIVRGELGSSPAGGGGGRRGGRDGMGGALDSEQEAHATRVDLARNIPFQTFVIKRCNRVLDATHRHEDHYSKLLLASGALEPGEATDDVAFHFERRADWGVLGLRMFKACETIVLAHCNTAPQRDADRSARDDLVMQACKGISSLVQMCATPGNMARVFATMAHPEAATPGHTQTNGSGGTAFLDGEVIATNCYFHLVQILHKLLKADKAREAEMVTQTIHSLSLRYPRSVGPKATIAAFTHCQSSQSKHKGLAKALLHLGLTFADAGKDIPFAKGLATALMDYDAEQEEGYMPVQAFAIINERSHRDLALACIAHCMDSLDDIEWAMQKMAKGADEVLTMRVDGVCGVLREFCEGDSPAQQVTDLLLKALTKAYKILGHMAKSQTAPKGEKQRQLHYAFVTFCDTCVRELTPSVNQLLLTIGGEEGRERVSESIMKRESKAVPNLIYQIEDCDRKLILLSKASGINLMKNAKRSAARDFKDPFREKKRRSMSA